MSLREGKKNQGSKKNLSHLKNSIKKDKNPEIYESLQ